MIESIFVRAETFPNEYRTPLVPDDVKILLQNGIHVFIQASKTRFFQDSLYNDISGCTLTSESWTHPDFKHSFIIGIKELSELECLNQHQHVYFSHTRKGQAGSDRILTAFTKSMSQLYDFEYITDHSGTRLIAFGFYAGVVGAALGLQEYGCRAMQKPSLQRLYPWSSFTSLLRSIPDVGEPTIAIIGSKGRCGQGVCSVLKTLGLKYIEFGKNDQIQGLETFDIVYNCIVLDTSYTHVWFSEETQFSHPIVIVDISCDSSKPNNPIQLYKTSTTWSDPVFHPDPLVSLIAIENLPSLLPSESSYHFSACLVPLLLKFPKDPWANALYTEKLSSGSTPLNTTTNAPSTI